jgi:hypothetical protein
MSEMRNEPSKANQHASLPNVQNARTLAQLVFDRRSEIPAKDMFGDVVLHIHPSILQTIVWVSYVA